MLHKQDQHRENEKGPVTARDGPQHACGFLRLLRAGILIEGIDLFRQIGIFPFPCVYPVPVDPVLVPKGVHIRILLQQAAVDLRPDSVPFRLRQCREAVCPFSLGADLDIPAHASFPGHADIPASHAQQVQQQLLADQRACRQPGPVLPGREMPFGRFHCRCNIRRPGHPDRAVRPGAAPFHPSSRIFWLSESRGWLSISCRLCST